MIEGWWQALIQGRPRALVPGPAARGHGPDEHGPGRTRPAGHRRGRAGAGGPARAPVRAAGQPALDAPPAGQRATAAQPRGPAGGRGRGRAGRAHRPGRHRGADRVRGRHCVRPHRGGRLRAGLAADPRGGRGRQHRRPGADRPARHSPGRRARLAGRGGAGDRVGAAGQLGGSLAWPLVISVAGLTLIWRNAPPDEQAVLRRLADPLLGLAEGSGSRRRIVARVAVAAVALALGLDWLVTGHQVAGALREIAGVILVVAAIAILLGPWWVRIARDLMVERQARIRAEERADMAARLHDSVLQTLALIQRRAEHPQQVIQLARAQERELRAWLFDGQAPGSLDGQDMTLAAGIRLIQQEVEAQHEVPVEAVTVGDCELDDDLRALLAAAREATVNAVKWSGAPVVSIFAEVEAAGVTLFVRDRGRGFDPAAVQADRKGLAESIRARMARRGGTAAVRTAPGEGTEVSLTMPRAAADRQPGRP